MPPYFLFFIINILIIAMDVPRFRQPNDAAISSPPHDTDICRSLLLTDASCRSISHARHSSDRVTSAAASISSLL